MTRTQLAILCVLCATATSSSHAQSRAADTSSLELRVGFAKPGGGYDVTMVPLETYVARVLAGEAARDSPTAALEALAIAIRTYGLANSGRHAAEGFDVCDQTHCQVVRTATAVTEQVAQATAARVLMRNGALAAIFYSASCGGRTEIPSNVWPGAEDPPHLPSRDDDACVGEPIWEAQISDDDLLRSLRAAGFHGNRLRQMRIASRNQSGRVARLKLDGLQPDEISAQDLRTVVGNTLGWQHVKSAAFELRRQSGVYIFNGHGYGHGVGMCVIGSVNLAAQGQTASAILQKYFPGLSIEPIGPSFARTAPGPRLADSAVSVDPGDIAISLPDDDEGEREALARMAWRARDDLARALDVPAPARLTLRFHPTTGEYERATGMPWFASGALVQGEVHLLPLAVLHERGVLERTIRHELVHVMIDGVLGRRPAWVREGAAIYFAGERPIPGEPVERPAFPLQPRTSCPDDNELLRPVSAGALTNAYARARICFAQQIAGGKTWRDVK